MPTLTPSSEDVRIYEVAVLYPHPIGQKEEKQLLDEVSKIFDEAEATMIDSDTWGSRGLAYTIGGHSDGNFVIYYYEMDPAKVKEVEEAIRIVPGVLRHIIVKPPKGYEVVKFSASYEKWLKERETESDRREREKEEEIKKKVAERAKRQAKRASEKKVVTEKKEEKPALEEAKLSEELEKIISDDELDL